MLYVAITLAVWAAITGGVYLFAELKGRSFGEFSRDPSAVLNGVFYTGYYSNLGILTWQVAATSALFTWFVLRRVGRSEHTGYLLYGGLLTALMMFDDFFLMHEEVYPKVGISDHVLFSCYALAMIFFAVRFRHRLGPGVLLVLAALGFWGTSVILDFTLHMDAPFVVEDGTKAAGTALWALLIVWRALAELTAALRSTESSTESSTERNTEHAPEPPARIQETSSAESH